MYGLLALKSGHCSVVAVVERFKQESMYGLLVLKSGHCSVVAVVERLNKSQCMDCWL